MSLNPESKPAANDTSQFIGRFLEERLIYERASRHDQLDYWLAKQELADHGHSIPDYEYLLKDLVKQHLKDFETENAAALQAKRFWDSPDCLRMPAWAKGKYGLEPSNDEATAFCFSKEDIYRLCLDRPIIGGRRQAQAADRKCLVIMLCTTIPDQCTCWSTFKCAVQRFAQLARCTHGPNMSNMTHKLPYTKSVVFCPEPQGQHQSFCSIVAIRYLELTLAAVVANSTTCGPHADCLVYAAVMRACLANSRSTQSMLQLRDGASPHWAQMTSSRWQKLSR